MIGRMLPLSFFFFFALECSEKTMPLRAVYDPLSGDERALL